MHRLLLLTLVWPLAALSASAADRKSDPEAVRDENLLRTAGMNTDNASLLAFFHDRTLTPGALEKFNGLVKQLGSPSYHTRARATTALIKMGSPVKALLLDVKKHASDEETARRAELCLNRLAKDLQNAPTVARLIGRRKPARAAEVLLAYLPFAAEEAVIDEVRTALAAVAAPDGKPAPVLVKALKGGKPLQRAAAVEALCRAHVKGLETECVKALAERDPHLRMQMAVALLEARRREAIPALIDLVRDLPEADAWQAEDALRRVASEKAPHLIVDRSTPALKVREAWQKWWDEQGQKLDLAKLELNPRLLGYTLLAQMDLRGTTGRVLELGPDKKVRWEITGLRYPVDAMVVRPNHVLIAEYLNRRVTERDFKGNIIWEKQVDLPIACQRLPNGHTFIATRRQLIEFDRDRKEVFTYHHPRTSISAARKLPDGQMLVVSGGQCTRLDARGRQVGSFHVGFVYNLGGNIDVLPGGRILVPEYTQNRVVEYDLKGQVRWKLQVQRPTSAIRLPNGHTLVVSITTRRVVEYNREGREVWSHRVQGRLWRARKR